jgi:hypothetical protein
MFNYYRFVGSKFSLVKEIIEQQAATEKLSLRLVSEFGQDQTDPNRITIMVRNDAIIDIYRG